MGYPVTVAGPGELRGYRPTEQWVDHPAGEHDPARVWTWRPELAEDQAGTETQDGGEASSAAAHEHDDHDDHGEDVEGQGADETGPAPRGGGGGEPVMVGELVAGVTRRARVLVCGHDGGPMSPRCAGSSRRRGASSRPRPGRRCWSTAGARAGPIDSHLMPRR